MNFESQAATSLVMEIYSLSILLLSCRRIHHHYHGDSGITGIFQMFSILKKLEKLKLLDLVDLMTWRSLFVSCDLIQDPDFSHTSIALLYELLQSIDGIVPDLFITEIFMRSLKKVPLKRSFHHKTEETDTDLDDKDSLRTLKRYLDLGSCSLEQIGLIWYYNKVCDHQKKTGGSVASPASLTRSRSNSVPTSHLSSSPPSKTSSKIWQRFKSRKSISIDDATERIILSDDSIDEILGLKSDPGGSVFALTARSPSSTHCLNMNMTAKEVGNAEELKLYQDLDVTRSTYDQKIQLWKRIKLPGVDKGDTLTTPRHPLSYST